ncbi:MAG: hypothetical protein J0H75_08475, partial [Rhizobiales bacterium]|nr:hypothetical protein [Hyphomicrobiales bacterium]
MTLTFLSRHRQTCSGHPRLHPYQDGDARDKRGTTKERLSFRAEWSRQQLLDRRVDRHRPG